MTETAEIKLRAAATREKQMLVCRFSCGLMLVFAWPVMNASAQAQPQVQRCTIDGRTVFQATPCPKPRSPDPAAAAASAQTRPDADALRAEQARRREDLQKGFRSTREVPRSTSEPSRIDSRSEPRSTSVEMSFEDCIRTIQSTASQLGAAPRNIVETTDMRMVRFITNDGSVLVTCSRADRKMVTTKSAN